MSDVIVSKFGSAAFSTPEMIMKTAQIKVSIDGVSRQADEIFVNCAAPEIRDAVIALAESLGGLQYCNLGDRFIEIARGLGVGFDVEAEIMQMKKNLFFGKGNDYVVSRG